MKHYQDPKRILLAMGWYRHNLHRGVAQYCRENGWALDELTHSPRLISQGLWDGAIATMQAPELAPVFRHVGTVVTLVSQPELKKTYPSVVQDLVEIGRLAADHLQKRGYRTLAYYTRNDEISSQHYAGFRRAADASGSMCRKLLLPKRQPARYRGNRDWHQAWITDALAQAATPLGVLAQNDQMAVEVIDACLHMGLRVPEDIAVVGVDNEKLICDCALVPLSSVDCNLFDQGYRAAGLLAKHLNAGKKTAPVLEIIAPRGVVVRRSSDTLVSDIPEAASVMQVIANNYKNSDFCVTELAAILGIPRRTIERTLQKYCGYGPGELLSRARMRKAQYLLEFTDWNIHEIGQAVGYPIPQNFHRAFRKHTGQTPSVYRKKG